MKISRIISLLIVCWMPIAIWATITPTAIYISSMSVLMVSAKSPAMKKTQSLTSESLARPQLHYW